MNYYKTILYYNVHDTTRYVVLANQSHGIIEQREKLQGFVAKEELSNTYYINYNDVGEHTYIIEYMTTALNSVEKIETFRIKVK